MYMNLVIWVISIPAVINKWVVSSIFAKFDYVSKIWDIIELKIYRKFYIVNSSVFTFAEVFDIPFDHKESTHEIGKY